MEGKEMEWRLFFIKPYFQVLLFAWEAESELEGGGLGRQAETAMRREGSNK